MNSHSEIFPEIEEYEFLRLLGQGAFGLVYHVRDKRSQEEYALKVRDLYSTFLLK
jgi:serine/threonine protein kinase